MFLHSHPYPPFIPEGATKLIVGTLPPPRFTQGKLKEGDVDFCYGSRDGLLWPILDSIFDLQLSFETSKRAIEERKRFLVDRGIGICDMVESARRKKIDASDLGMLEIELRDLVQILKNYPSIDTLLFTGGNSKNGPEYFFRRLLKKYDLSLELKVSERPKIHQVKFPKTGRIVKTVSLIAPSGAANRAIGSTDEYKAKKAINKSYNTLDFRKEQYKKFF